MKRRRGQRQGRMDVATGAEVEARARRARGSNGRPPGCGAGRPAPTGCRSSTSTRPRPGHRRRRREAPATTRSVTATETDVLAVEPRRPVARSAGSSRVEPRLVLRRESSPFPASPADGTTSGLLSRRPHAGSDRAAGRDFPRRATPASWPSTPSRHAADTAAVEPRTATSVSTRSRPDGSTACYLVHYISKHDPTKYEVRGYDVARERGCCRTRSSTRGRRRS